jgi:hypothetical protein
MVVDCGGGTVDLTTRKLVGINPLQLGEVKERQLKFLTFKIPVFFFLKKKII